MVHILWGMNFSLMICYMRSHCGNERMKRKIVLLIGVLLSKGLWAVPMDEICSLKGNTIGGFDKEAWNRLENQCVKNNILEVKIFLMIL